MENECSIMSIFLVCRSVDSNLFFGHHGWKLKTGVSSRDVIFLKEITQYNLIASEDVKIFILDITCLQ